MFKYSDTYTNLSNYSYILNYPELFISEDKVITESVPETPDITTENRAKIIDELISKDPEMDHLSQVFNTTLATNIATDIPESAEKTREEFETLKTSMAEKILKEAREKAFAGTTNKSDEEIRIAAKQCIDAMFEQLFDRALQNSAISGMLDAKLVAQKQ
jgi:hypothetical protein